MVFLSGRGAASFSRFAHHPANAAITAKLNNNVPSLFIIFFLKWEQE
jgi:hypothetical protein